MLIVSSFNRATINWMHSIYSILQLHLHRLAVIRAIVELGSDRTSSIRRERYRCESSVVQERNLANATGDSGLLITKLHRRGCK